MRQRPAGPALPSPAPTGRLRRRMATFTAALLLVGVVTTGCAGPDSQWVAPRAAATTGTGSAAPNAGAPTWTDCADVARHLLNGVPRGITYQCATIKVPQDWTADNGETFDIALLRARSSRQTDRVGSLLINPGGPGGSGVDYAVYLSQLPQLNSRFDIVGFDPRGVGRSTQVKCMTDAQLDTIFGFDPDPTAKAEFDKFVAVNREVSEACSTKYGESLRLFSTVQTARDMDAVRKAVGDEKTTYLGYSYGTLLGAVYAHLFPTNIRALVLDGAIDPTEQSETRSEGQARGFERAFDNFAQWCAQTAASCPVAPDPRAVVQEQLAAARTAPKAGAGGRQATPGWIFTAVVASLYVKDDWEKLARALDDLRDGDTTGIFTLADGYAERDQNGHYTNLFDANTAVNCNDYDTYPTLERIRALQSQWRKKYPLFGAGLAMGMVNCAVWPTKHDPYPVGAAKGAPPILVVGTKGDPATPYEQAPKLAKVLGTGVLLTWDGEGHTAYPQTLCVTQAVNNYLINLRAPTDGTVCPA